MSIWISATSTGDKRAKVTMSDGTEHIIEPGGSLALFAEGDLEVRCVAEIAAETDEGSPDAEG